MQSNFVEIFAAKNYGYFSRANDLLGTHPIWMRFQKLSNFVDLLPMNPLKDSKFIKQKKKNNEFEERQPPNREKKNENRKNLIGSTHYGTSLKS